MTTWDYLKAKGVGVTALAILLSGITAANTWDALVEKSTAPEGSTAYIHLISVINQTDVNQLGGAFDDDGPSLRARIQADDEAVLQLLLDFLNSEGRF